MAITKDMGIVKIVETDPDKVMPVFQKYGLHCVGCMASHFETLEQGCAAHGIDVEKLVVDINKALESK